MYVQSSLTIHIHTYVGTPLDCIVDSINEAAKTVTVRAHPKAVADALTRSSKLAFTSVRAGMLVNFVVDKLAQVIESYDMIYDIYIYVFCFQRYLILILYHYVILYRMELSAVF